MTFQPSGSGLERLSFLNRSFLHLVLIAGLGLLVYSNTFNVPFQWDEKLLIAENPLVRNIDYFLEPSKAEGLGHYDAFKSRYAGYLTFALNYKLHGLDVTGYHIVNLFVHILNALLVYLLVVLTFKTPFLDNSSLKKHSKYIALFSSLLFVSHPVQTEAVTYIFQRLASLVAFFYLLSISAYTGFRLSTGNVKRYTLYALSLISAVLAMKTKENAFTLPFVIMLYEFFFFRGRTTPRMTPRMTPLIPFLLTLLIIPLTLTGIDKPAGEIISGIETATTGYKDISRLDYLFTELRVIVTYMRLLFLPINQNIDYDYPVFHSFSNPQVFLSSMFLVAVFGLGIYLFYRSRHGEAGLRLTAFGLFWFFITLSVESSIIPIPMIINEYRVYLPSVGIFVTVMTTAFLLTGRLKTGKLKAFAASFFILVLLVLSYATYARNNVWRSEVTLWEDVVKKSPGKARVYNNLGNAYWAEGLTDKAVEHYRIALRLKPDYTKAHNNLGNAYWFKGLIDKAIEHYRIVLRLEPDHAKAHNNLGSAYVSKGLFDKAAKQYRIALRLKPDFAEAHFNLGIVYLKQGFTDKARGEFETALRIDPRYSKARKFLDYISNQNKVRPGEEGVKP